MRKLPITPFAPPPRGSAPQMRHPSYPHSLLDIGHPESRVQEVAKSASTVSGGGTSAEVDPTASPSATYGD